MYSVKLQWKQFNVDLASMEAWVKALEPSCVGNSAGADLEFHFTSDVNALPSEEQTIQEERTTQQEVEVPTLDQDGEPVLDGDGNPMTHMELQDVTEMVDVVIQVPTGEPSVAQKIQAKWESIDANHAMATAYTQKAQKAAIQAQVARSIEFGRKMIEDFATENVMMGITLEDKTEEVLEIATPMMNALQSGSLTVAIKRAKAIPVESHDDKYITPARLLAYVNKMEAFMGLPLSQSL